MKLFLIIYRNTYFIIYYFKDKLKTYKKFRHISALGMVQLHLTYTYDCENVLNVFKY